MHPDTLRTYKAVKREMKETRMQCDCGSITFMKFGPYRDEERKEIDGCADDLGLRWIYTCSKCGEQLRVYQGSKMGKFGTVPADV
jgi:DNA-directed RNA polymerase subunit RPC12/RpoP